MAATSAGQLEESIARHKLPLLCSLCNPPHDDCQNNKWTSEFGWSAGWSAGWLAGCQRPRFTVQDLVVRCKWQHTLCVASGISRADKLVGQTAVLSGSFGSPRALPSINPRSGSLRFLCTWMNTRHGAHTTTLQDGTTCQRSRDFLAMIATRSLRKGEKNTSTYSSPIQTSR